MNKPKIVIQAGKQSDGYVFRLQPKSREWLRSEFPEKHRVASLFIGFDEMKEAPQIHNSIWNQVSILLTSLSIQEVNQVGGLKVVNPPTGKEIFNSLQSYV